MAAHHQASSENTAAAVGAVAMVVVLTADLLEAGTRTGTRSGPGIRFPRILVSICIRRQRYFHSPIRTRHGNRNKGETVYYIPTDHPFPDTRLPVLITIVEGTCLQLIENTSSSCRTRRCEVWFVENYPDDATIFQTEGCFISLHR